MYFSEVMLAVVGELKLKSKKATNTPYFVLTKIYIYVLITIFLLYVGSNGYLTIQDAKFKAFCIIGGGYIFLMAILSLERLAIGVGHVVSPKQLLLKSTWPQRLAIAYLILTWLSALFSDYFPDTIIGATRYEGALTISIYVLCFLLVCICGGPDKPMLIVFGITVTLFCIVALVQVLFDLNIFNLFPDGYTYSDSYVEFPSAYAGTIGNIDFVSAFLCLVIPLIWISIAKLHSKLRYALLIPLLMALALLVTLGVLAGFVGVVIGALLSIPFVFIKNTKGMAIYFAALAVFIICAAIGIFFIDTGSGLFHELHEILHGRVSGDFGSGRLHIWSEVLGRLWERPLLGYGPDTMIYSGMEPFTRYDEHLGAMIVSEIDSAHNEYLNIAFHQGIPAMLIYLAMLLFVARDWVINRHDAEVCALGGAALSYCIQAFFGISICITSPFFWLTIGLLEGRVKELKCSGGKKLWGRN